MKKSILEIGEALVKIIVSLIRIGLRIVLFISIRLYRHFGIETPIYRKWWMLHCIKIQKKLDEQHVNIIPEMQ